MLDLSGGPIVIGLTGEIGTGKSNVLETLVSLGAEGIDADQVAHQVMEPGGAVHGALVATFGPEVVGADGCIDRPRLAARVFGDGAALRQLEAIVHPAVVASIRERVARSRAPMVVIEAIKLLEAGLHRQLCDQVWVTACSREQQFRRLAASRGMSAAEVRRRLAVQMPASEMAAQADRVIDTSGTIAETALFVLAAWAELGLPFPEPSIGQGTVADAEGIAAVLNAAVQEGGWTVIDRTFTPAQERAFLRRLPDRARVVVAKVGRTIGAFQVIEPYSTRMRAMGHVATLGSYVIPPLRRMDLGRALSQATFGYAREVGFTKILANVRADNADVQAFYESLGFLRCGRLARQALVDGKYVDMLLFERFL